MTSKPQWMEWAEGEIGEKEVPGPQSNPRIMEYRDIAGIKIGGEDGVVPWCKVFVNAALKEAGLPVRPSAMARDIESDPNFVELDGPAYGCIVVFWRGSRKGGSGHIGFYLGETASRVLVLGGNQGDMVKQSFFPKNGTSLGVTGYYWPASVEDPEGGAIRVSDDGSPVDSAV